MVQVQNAKFCVSPQKIGCYVLKETLEGLGLKTERERESNCPTSSLKQMTLEMDFYQLLTIISSALDVLHIPHNM